MCLPMVAVAAMFVVRWGGSTTAKIEEVAMAAAEEACVGQAVAMKCIGGGGEGGDSSGIEEGEGKGSGDGSDVGCCGDVHRGGNGNSNNDIDGGNGDSNSGSGIDGNVFLSRLRVEGCCQRCFFWCAM
jgi:hypothetical protein